MIVLEYVAKFIELAHFGDDYVASVMAKVRKFEDGLKLSIQGKIMGLLMQDMHSMVRTALAMEREIDDARSIRDTGAGESERRASLLRARERSKGLLIHESPKDRTSHPKRYFWTPSQPRQRACF